MNKYRLGIDYFWIHLINEISCFYILTNYLSLSMAAIVMLLYDFYAFVPQGIYGYIKDEFKIKLHFGYVGFGIVLLSLLLFKLNIYPLIVVLVLTVGNALIHVQGAIETLQEGKGKMTSSAIFVGGGSIGVVIGKVIGAYTNTFYLVIMIHLLMLVPLYLTKLHPIKYSDELTGYHYVKKGIPMQKVIVISFIVVCIRSFISYGIPTSWNQTMYQMILLYLCMGIGKGLGGILIDHIGMEKTLLLSTIGAIPFLICGNHLMIISLIGILLFSMTMAIALALVVSVLPKYPGVAFGITTAALFTGTVPIFLFRIESYWINCILVSGLSLMSYYLFKPIIQKEKMIDETIRCDCRK